MKIFKKFKLLNSLNEVLIEQIKKNTNLLMSMYNDKYVTSTDILNNINERLSVIEQEVISDTYNVDEVIYNEMICIKELIYTISDIVPSNTYNQYNDIVLVTNLIFDKGMTLNIINVAQAL